MNKRSLALAGSGLALLLVVCLTVGVLAGLAGTVLPGYTNSAGVSITPLTPRVTPSPTGTALSAGHLATPLSRAASDPAPSVEPLPPPAPTSTPVIAASPSAAPLPVVTAAPPASPAAPTPTAPDQNYATRLTIPRLGLDVPVVLAPVEGQTWRVDHLGQRVGHLQGTAAPGAASNLVVAGHVSLAAGVAGPFAKLADLSPGDVVVVYGADEPFTYIIEHQQIVAPTGIEVTYPTRQARLTLITCNGWDDTLAQYTDRLVVIGHLVHN